MKKIFSRLTIILFIATSAFAFYNNTPHGFVTAQCTNGVTDIYVVNSEWICVVNDYMSNYWEYIQQQGWTFTYGGNPYTYYSAVSNYVGGHKNLWWFEDVIQGLHDNHIHKARGAFERPLNSNSFYTITSPDDSNYSSGVEPLQTERFCTSIKQWEDHGVKIGGQMHNVNYSWLKLPTPMADGRRYTVTLGNGFSGNFLYSETQTICRVIKVNQVGYLPWAPEKYAYWGCWTGTGGALEFNNITNRTFEIINDQNGAAVFSGNITLRYDPTTDNDAEEIGEYVYQMDFSSFNSVGTFFIKIPGVGRSWPFKIADDIYGEPFYKVMKGVYNQRSGFEIKEQYLNWPREEGHKYVYKSSICQADSREWENQEAQAVIGDGKIGYFDMADAEMWKLRYLCKDESEYYDFYIFPRKNKEWRDALDATYTITNCYGGWYDAADFDRRPGHLYGIFDLITAFMMNSNGMTDSQCNFEESGNGIPDILDEVNYGLRQFKTSQTKSGGVSTRFESYSHPYRSWMPSEDPMPYFANMPDGQGSVMYAAGAALFSYVVRPYDAALADDYLDSAKKAYKFAYSEKSRIRNISYWLPTRRDSDSMDAILADFEPKIQEYKESSTNEYVWSNFARSEKYIHNNYHSYIYRLREFRYEQPEDFFPRDNREVGPFFWMAPFYLYLASGEQKYADIVNGSNGFERFDYDDTSSFYGGAFVAAFTHPAAINSSIINICSNWIINYANGSVSTAENNPYRNVAGHSAWGGSTQQRRSKRLFHAFAVSGNSNYLAKAILANDFMMGCRPGDLTFSTGIGWSYICHLLAFNRHDNILEPPPGYTSFAPLGNYPWEWNYRGWRCDYGSVEEYFLPAPFDGSESSISSFLPDWRIPPVYEPNAMVWEFTVNETITPTVLGYSILVPPGWTPDNDLKNLQPKPKNELYGYYFMP